MAYRPVIHPPRPCAYCGTPYVPKRSDGKFCSDSCCTRSSYAVNGRPGQTSQRTKAKAAKEVSFLKLSAASAVGHAAVEIIENVLDVGNAAQMKKMEKQVQQLNRKFDALTGETTSGVEGAKVPNALPGPAQALKLNPHEPTPIVRNKEMPRAISNRFSKYGEQFDAKDIVM